MKRVEKWKSTNASRVKTLSIILLELNLIEMNLYSLGKMYKFKTKVLQKPGVMGISMNLK